MADGHRNKDQEYDPSRQICIRCDKPMTLCDCYCDYCGKLKEKCICGGADHK